MRKGLWLGTLLLLMGASLSAQGFSHYRDQFWKQMRATCRPGLRWEKSVTELEGSAVKSNEVRTFDLDCQKGTATDAKGTLNITGAEFAHLFEFAFDNPYLEEHLDLKRDAQGVTATVKSGHESDCKLQAQRFSIDPATGNLSEAHAHIKKGSLLYDLEVDITVKFGPDGRYLSHQIETRTDVWLGGEVHTQIQAHLLP
ncbi:MAG: hypothetical protein U0176_08485 [Bacteroidia bacterium]